MSSTDEEPTPPRSPGFYRSPYSPWNNAPRELPPYLPYVPDAIKKVKGYFQIVLDIQPFKQNEITVTIIENTICVQGSHEEKQEGEASVTRSFVKKYKLPKGKDVDELTATFTHNAELLVISAPKKKKLTLVQRIIPIILCSINEFSKRRTRPSLDTSSERNIPIAKVAGWIPTKKSFF